MAIYFFHITEGDEFISDPEGVACRDLATVRKVGFEGASALIAEAVKKGAYHYRGRLDVEDEQGGQVFALTFSCAVQIEGAVPQATQDQVASGTA